MDSHRRARIRVRLPAGAARCGVGQNCSWSSTASRASRPRSASRTRSSSRTRSNSEWAMGTLSRRPSFSEINVTKQLDKASPQLMLRTANGCDHPVRPRMRFTTQGSGEGRRVPALLLHRGAHHELQPAQRRGLEAERETSRSATPRSCSRTPKGPRRGRRPGHGLRHRAGTCSRTSKSLRPFVATDQVGGSRRSSG